MIRLKASPFVVKWRSGLDEHCGGGVDPQGREADTFRPEEGSSAGPRRDDGVDESGKGGNCGLLVVAAVWVAEENSAPPVALGVRDGKTLSDRQVRLLARSVRGHPDAAAIRPRRDNEPYASMRNLGRLPTRACARATEGPLVEGGG